MEPGTYRFVLELGQFGFYGLVVLCATLAVVAFFRVFFGR